MPLRSAGMVGLRRQWGHAGSARSALSAAGPGRRDRAGPLGAEHWGRTRLSGGEAHSVQASFATAWDAAALLGAASSSGCKRVRAQAVLGPHFFLRRHAKDQGISFKLRAFTAVPAANNVLIAPTPRSQ